ncbi:hypothetical protein M409DRAFT_60128 [Zasmidium cellare ATCC 36951]|uniref:Uncharacterized protein n=1 Tax=Zasmidium cellare ATCC 36951 TaxID=1080233 RepID=A0A6A6C1Q9_ZASCE|nr:uncharacterized protein M409DRAFT_60128 [Zasmidium cellare ATCC 36951]KAF2160208.1 hypothetical protein M409DRAFT_60128 [Zasmidium cellare ATCC 36951]
MGTKRKRSKQKTHQLNQVWPDGVVDELLSFLNSQVALLEIGTESLKQVELESLDQDVARHLNHRSDDGEQTLEQCHNYSPKQIRRKLSRLFHARRRSETDSDNWTVIYTKGFACLDWADDSERLIRMARRAKEIKHKWKWDFLHSPRRTRAGSRSRSVAPDAREKSVDVASASTSVAKHTRASRPPQKHPLRQSIEAKDRQEVKLSAFCKDLPTWLTSQVSDTESARTENDENVADPTVNMIRERDSSRNIAQVQLPPIRKRRLRSQQLADSETEAPNTPLGKSCPSKSRIRKCVAESGQSPATLHLEDRLQAVQQELRAVRRDSGREIKFWKDEYRKAQTDRTGLRKANVALVAGINATRSLEGGKVSGHDIVEREALLDDLLLERDSRADIVKMKNTMDMAPAQETEVNVSTLMKSMRIRLQAVLEDAEFSSIDELPELPEDHRLRFLVEQAFGVEPDSQEAMQVLKRWCGSPGLRQHALLALCGAAIARWVFQQPQADLLFDRYQSIRTRGSTNRYREAIQIVAHNDPPLARAVDLTVHKTVAAEASFERFKKMKGERLACRLQDTLAPLCQLDRKAADGSDSDSELGKYTAGHLSGVFHSAIDVHCRLILTGRQYECVWFECSTPFDRESMTTISVGKGVTRASESTIRLTLFPGISQITATKIGVDFGGFTERRHKAHEEALFKYLRIAGTREQADNSVPLGCVLNSHPGLSWVAGVSIRKRKPRSCAESLETGRSTLTLRLPWTSGKPDACHTNIYSSKFWRSKQLPSPDILKIRTQTRSGVSRRSCLSEGCKQTLFGAKERGTMRLVGSITLRASCSRALAASNSSAKYVTNFYGCQTLLLTRGMPSHLSGSPRNTEHGGSVTAAWLEGRLAYGEFAAYEHALASDADRVRPGSPSIFSNKSDEQVMHDVTGTEKVTLDQKYKRPDRVYGLSRTGSFDLFGDRLGKYSPFFGKHTIFPFMVVEAKSDKSEDGFHVIEQQTALSIRTCLKIQTSLEIESNRNLDPLVWFFGFRGDVWRLYIALPVNDRTKIIDCWHGRMSSADEALQLLLIVDWICFWAKDVHRKGILKCLSGLEAREITPASTVFSSQGDLNDRIPPTRSTSLVFRSSRPPISRLENDEQHVGDGALVNANVSQSELMQRGLGESQSRLQGGDDAFSAVRNAREVVNEWNHFALPEDEESMLECLAAICIRGNVQETAKLLWETLTDNSHTVKMSLRKHEVTESASEEPMAVFLACQSRLSELSWQVKCTYWCVTSTQAAAHILAAVADITGAEVFSLNFWSAHDCDCLGSAIAGFQRLGGRAIAAAAISQDIFCIHTTHSGANTGHSEWLKSDRQILQPRVAMLWVLFGQIGNMQQKEMPAIAVPRSGEGYLPPSRLFETDSLNGVPGVILKKPESWRGTCPVWCYLSFELGGHDSVGQQIALALQQRAIYAASGLSSEDERSIEQWALSTMDIMQSIDASGLEA